MCCRYRPSLLDAFQVLAEFGQTRPKLGRNQRILAETGPNLGSPSNYSTTCWARRRRQKTIMRSWYLAPAPCKSPMRWPPGPPQNKSRSTHRDPGAQADLVRLRAATPDVAVAAGARDLVRVHRAATEGLGRLGDRRAPPEVPRSQSCDVAHVAGPLPGSRGSTLSPIPSTRAPVRWALFPRSHPRGGRSRESTPSRHALPIAWMLARLQARNCLVSEKRLLLAQILTRSGASYKARRDRGDSGGAGGFLGVRSMDNAKHRDGGGGGKRHNTRGENSAHCPPLRLGAHMFSDRRPREGSTDVGAHNRNSGDSNTFADRRVEFRPFGGPNKCRQVAPGAQWQIEPACARCWPNLGNFSQNLTKCGQVWSNVAKGWPTPA